MSNNIDTKKDILDNPLIKEALSNLKAFKFSDGTEYMQMPRGNWVRMSKRSYEIRKNNK